MATLRFDSEQRFTCRECARCCRRGWDISLTAGEVEAYRQAEAARWYREAEDEPEGAGTDPFEPIPGHAPHHRIRKRRDGACGFLSQEGLCRLHEELGARRKPLTCQLFPFRFHPADGLAVVTASYCCPTVVRNDGASLGAQRSELDRLRREWSRAWPEPSRTDEFVKGHPVTRTTATELRTILRQMLDRPGPEGRPDLRKNLLLMATTLDDLTRRRVLGLAPEAFAEYLELTGRHAAGSDKEIRPRPPTRVARLLSRGFLFVVVATRLQLQDGRSSGLRLGLRLRLFRLLAHVNGLGPPVSGVELGATRRVTIDLSDPAAHALAYNFLRASIETLGTGRRPLLDELAVSVAFLNAAMALAAMRAAQAGRVSAQAADLAEGLMEAVDLSHAESRGMLGSIVTSFAGGVEALYLFAHAKPVR